MSAVRDVTVDDFDAVVLAGPKPVLVDFWRQACAPCRMLAPVLDRFAEDQDAIDIVKVNVEENPDLATACGVSSIPALNLYVGGELVKSLVGPKTLAVLNAEFGPYGNPA